MTSLNPDLINLHWICGGFLRLEKLRKIKKPIVWTLHDMWAFTGGCHYSSSCERYQEECGECPQLGSKKGNDLSRRIWKRKKKAWQNMDLTIVTPSRWLSECARKSSLFKGLRVETIPYGLDTERYRPIDKKIAREVMGLPLDKKLILFGAMYSTSDRRKGFQFLQPALQELAKDDLREKAELVVFGATEPANPVDLGLKVNYVGQLHDDVSLALLYAAADLFVAPSVQDNLPCTVIESLACGTPVVAFDVGGMPDMVEHKVNGYLARPFETDDLAKGIRWVIEDDKRLAKLVKAAAKKAQKEYSLDIQARRYLELYKEIVKKG